MTPNTILNTRIGFSRFNEPSIRQYEGNFHPAALGFPAATSALFGPEQYLPRFEIGGGSSFNIFTAQPNLTRIVGVHTFRAGYDYRVYRENGYGPGQAELPASAFQVKGGLPFLNASNRAF